MLMHYIVVFTRESSYCFQCVFSHHNSVCPSVCLSVCLSHVWISEKRCNLDHQIFTVGCLEDSSFRNRKLFYKFKGGHTE